MPITLIEQKPNFEKKVIGNNKLSISEMFADTIQGEGPNTGVLSTFIRLQGCTLKCVWCDTLDVWSKGNEYSFNEIFELFESINLIDKLKNGQHLILTGGSPLKQQYALVNFINEFILKYGFKPYIEVENEGVLMPTNELVDLVDWWNNSPKLQNSGMKFNSRVKPIILSYMGSLPNSIFKFVVSNEEDWVEIKETFINTNFISKDKIVLMPEGQTQEELSITRPIAADMAIKHGVRLTDRLHITIWDRATSV